MNQQRARRFLAAKERKERLSASEDLSDEEDAPMNLKDSMDFNCITPGTSFMDNVAHAIRFYIMMKQASDPGWQSIQVIFSDSSVPGEGEHKIMEFIRVCCFRVFFYSDWCRRNVCLHNMMQIWSM